MLNNKPLRLCGAARHQDWQGLGSALTEQQHEEDISLLMEMGANTVRLAHYQHPDMIQPEFLVHDLLGLTTEYHTLSRDGGILGFENLLILDATGVTCPINRWPPFFCNQALKTHEGEIFNVKN